MGFSPEQLITFETRVLSRQDESAAEFRIFDARSGIASTGLGRLITTPVCLLDCGQLLGTIARHIVGPGQQSV